MPEPTVTPSKFFARISPVHKLNEGKSMKGKNKGEVGLISKEKREELKKRLDQKSEKELKKKVGMFNKLQNRKRKLNFYTNASVSDDYNADAQKS